jgi:hypothetical protein
VQRLTIPSHVLLVASHAAVALGFMLVPFTFVAPCAETLMVGVVAGKVAVLYEPLFVVATSDKVDLLVEAHVDIFLAERRWIDCATFTISSGPSTRENDLQFGRVSGVDPQRLVVALKCYYG